MKNLIFILSFFVGPASAAVLTPTLFTGANSIDPTGGRNDLNLTVSGAALKADLVAVAGFAVVQGWTGHDASVGTAPNATSTNILDFTGRPDARFSFVGEAGRNSPSGTGGAAAYTSGPATPVGGESLFFGTDSQNLLTIDFGAYDSLTSTFAANAGVAAAGFTFSRNTAATVGTSWKAVFYDGATILSTQTVDAGTNQTVSALFAYIAQTGEKITRIEIGGSGTNYNSKNHFVDDFGFAAIPEPASTLLGGIGLLALLRRRR